MKNDIRTAQPQQFRGLTPRQVVDMFADIRKEGGIMGTPEFNLLHSSAGRAKALHKAIDAPAHLLQASVAKTS